MANSLLFNNCKNEVYSNGMAVEPEKVQNRGYGCEEGVGQSAKYSSNAVTGHAVSKESVEVEWKACVPQMMGKC